MRKLYADRQQMLVSALKGEFGDLFDIRPAGAGMYIIGWLPRGWDDVAFARLAGSKGLILRPVSPFHYKRTSRHGVMLGHASVTSGQLKSGIRLLAKTAAEYAGRAGRLCSAAE